MRPPKEDFVQGTIDVVGVGASVATAIGVIIAAWQLGLAQAQARTQFEDSLNIQYREIIRRLPVEALLSENLEPGSERGTLRDFYDYFDLSNEQAFLRRQGRIRKRTWEDWREGITQNLGKPAFAAAWQEVSHRSAGFSDLKELVPIAAQLAKAALRPDGKPKAVGRPS